MAAGAQAARVDLEASREFTTIYGEFHAVWKVWHAHLKADNALVAGIDESLRHGLLERAAAEEGRFNALVLKLVAERKLGENDTKVLAMFREAQQCLRESVEQNSLLATRKPAGGEPASWQAGGAPYLRFKELATRVADLVANAPRRRGRPGDPTDLAQSTRRDFSRNWWTPVPPASWR